MRHFFSSLLLTSALALPQGLLAISSNFDVAVFRKKTPHIYVEAEDPWSLARRAEVLAQEGDYAQASSLLGRALNVPELRVEEKAHLLGQLGDIHFQWNEFGTAIDLYGEALGLPGIHDEWRGELMACQGDAWYAFGYPQPALERFGSALAYIPGDSSKWLAVQYRRGMMAFDLERYDDAHAYFMLVAQSVLPLRYQAFVCLGEVNGPGHLNRWRESLSYFEQALTERGLGRGERNRLHYMAGYSGLPPEIGIASIQDYHRARHHLIKAMGSGPISLVSAGEYVADGWRSEDLFGEEDIQALARYWLGEADYRIICEVLVQHGIHAKPNISTPWDSLLTLEELLSCNPHWASIHGNEVRAYSLVNVVAFLGGFYPDLFQGVRHVTDLPTGPAQEVLALHVLGRVSESRSLYHVYGPDTYYAQTYGFRPSRYDSAWPYLRVLTLSGCVGQERGQIFFEYGRGLQKKLRPDAVEEDKDLIARAFRLALELGGDNPQLRQQAQAYLAVAHYSRGDTDMALQYAQQVVGLIPPSDQMTWDQLINIAYKLAKVLELKGLDQMHEAGLVCEILCQAFEADMQHVLRQSKIAKKRILKLLNKLKPTEKFFQKAPWHVKEHVVRLAVELEEWKMAWRYLRDMTQGVKAPLAIYLLKAQTQLHLPEMDEEVTKLCTRLLQRQYGELSEIECAQACLMLGQSLLASDVDVYYGVKFVRKAVGSRELPKENEVEGLLALGEADLKRAAYIANDVFVRLFQLQREHPSAKVRDRAKILCAMHSSRQRRFLYRNDSLKIRKGPLIHDLRAIRAVSKLISPDDPLYPFFLYEWAKLSAAFRPYPEVSSKFWDVVQAPGMKNHPWMMFKAFMHTLRTL